MKPRRFGPYRLQTRLGSGATADVWLARDERLARDVALKVFRGASIVAGAALREARTAAGLNHPNIVQLYDVLVEPGQVVFVMEYLQGGDLRRLLKSGPQHPARVVEVLLDITSGLAAAEAAGLVHRDLAAGNVLLGADGRARIGDFGIAISRAASRAVAGGQLPGTRAALSPEHYLGRALDARSDLFCAGLLGFQLLTHAHPFWRDGALCVRTLTEQGAPSLAQQRPDLPAGLAVLIDALLALDPARRPSSARDVRAALMALWADLPVPLQA